MSLVPELPSDLQNSASQNQKKITPKQEHKYIKIDNYTYRYKDTTQSDKYGGKKFQYECIEKLCNCYIHLSVTFCFCAFFPKESVCKPKIILVSEDKKRSKTLYADIDDKTMYIFGQHKETCAKSEIDFLEPKVLASFDRDFEVLKKEILKNPLQSSHWFLDLMKKLNQKFTLNQIKYQLKSIRDEIFPRDLDALILAGNCLTRDPGRGKKQGFCQIKSLVPYIPYRAQSQANTPSKPSEFVIFGSNYMLNLLAQNPVWMMDATFKITPKGFYQFLSVLIYDERVCMYIPGAYVLMTSKQQLLYELVFDNLKAIVRKYSPAFKGPQKVILDFEQGLRNAVVKCFPNVKIDGCFFHFSKALWGFCAKVGLKQETDLKDTQLLVALMKCLVHMDESTRKEIWKDLCDIWKEKGERFKIFLKYFQKNWLSSYFIDFVNCTPEDLRFRSNNACESFNAKLMKKVGIKHPQIGILVNCLLDLEFEYRTSHLEQINSGSQVRRQVIQKEDCLPFSQIYLLLEQKKPVIRRYNLRSLNLEEELWLDILKASNECYQYFFANKLIDDLDSNSSSDVVLSSNQEQEMEIESDSNPEEPLDFIEDLQNVVLDSRIRPPPEMDEQDSQNDPYKKTKTN